MKTLLTIALGLALVAGGSALAGCSAHHEPVVATAGHAAATGSPGGAVPSPSASESDYDKALRYTRCMTDHGTKMADPVVGKMLQYGDPPDGSGWQRMTNDAFQKCKQFLPATWPIKIDPAEIARDKPFDACMRKHGMDVPEPDANGMIAYPADPTVQDTPEFNAAVEACRYTIDDPANNQ